LLVIILEDSPAIAVVVLHELFLCFLDFTSYFAWKH
jgi:hypothetical protein